MFLKPFPVDDYIVTYLYDDEVLILVQSALYRKIGGDDEFNCLLGFSIVAYDRSRLLVAADF